MSKIMFNADDYAISKNISDCINDLSKKNKIFSTSVFSNTTYFNEIKENLISIPVKKGLHFSLTEGYSLSNSSLLMDETGFLKYSAKNLYLKYITGCLNKNLFNQIIDEFHSQYDELSKYCEVEHISSHEHVHMIPPIYNYLEKFSTKNNIRYLRDFNEDLFTFYNFNDFKNFFYDLNFIKYFLIMFLTKIRKKKINNNIKTYGLKFSGKLSYKNLEYYINSLKKNEVVDIYLHPGYKTNKKINFKIKDYDRDFILSSDRQIEFEAISKYTSNEMI